ncbi:MAG: HNH endonuclease [Janthinobacterium lividum]
MWSKESRQSRGYGPDWDKLRLVILARDKSICQPCRKRGLIHPGREVDHIISKANAEKMGWSKQQIDSPSNLQTICRAAHVDKTAEEKGYRVRKQIGADGWPID